MSFGTAGLRAKMGAGYDRINDLTIIQTSQGLSSYLLSKCGSEMCSKFGVVVGFDGRHNSKRFCDLVSNIFIIKGFKVLVFNRCVPTPFVAFAVKVYNCAAGIMITASHNPKEDNGYKVYWSNGAQIIPPHDKGISDSILLNLEPWPKSWNIADLKQCTVDIYEDVVKKYYSELLNYCHFSSLNKDMNVKFVYTAMHGVGYPFVKMAFETFNLSIPIPVVEQVEIDPDFPTVKYPNPEEGESALNLAISTANANDCTIIIANDPDADRLAVAECTTNSITGQKKWRVFNGNELGSLFAWWAWKNYNKHGSTPYMIASTVSSKFLRSMAEIEGFNFKETLTGFKWMGNLSYDLTMKGESVLFAYEEAIGFMYGTNVFDKDGISAAAVIMELVSFLKKHGLTLSLKLQELYTEYGYFLTHNSYYLCNSSESIKRLFGDLRKNGEYPSACGSARVDKVIDLTIGYDSSRPPDYKPDLPSDPCTQHILFSLNNNCEVTLRTSGTEPKIKYYIEVFSSPGIVNVSELESRLQEMVKFVVSDFLRPKIYGLTDRV